MSIWLAIVAKGNLPSKHRLLCTHMPWSLSWLKATPARGFHGMFTIAFLCGAFLYLPCWTSEIWCHRAIQCHLPSHKSFFLSFDSLLFYGLFPPWRLVYGYVGVCLMVVLCCFYAHGFFLMLIIYVAACMVLWHCFHSWLVSRGSLERKSTYSVKQCTFILCLTTSGRFWRLQDGDLWNK